MAKVYKYLDPVLNKIRDNKLKYAIFHKVIKSNIVLDESLTVKKGFPHFSDISHISTLTRSLEVFNSKFNPSTSYSRLISRNHFQLLIKIDPKLV